MASHLTDGRPAELGVPVTKTLTKNLDPFVLMKATPYVLKYLICRETEVVDAEEKLFFFQLTSPYYPDGKTKMCCIMHIIARCVSS
jgi:hypothetical protein